ncbi:MAG: glycoside hydrolase family 5 protein [Proteobacteria bacterium]|nr:glycoside hydrolase family 5 protein [Pseudomonadota bacterium]
MALDPHLDTQRLTSDGRRLLDSLGREVLLRGINCGGRSKFPPYFPFAFVESGVPGQDLAPTFAEAMEAYCDRLTGWGLNTVRLPFSWEALEPTRGTFDELWLARYVALTEAIGRRGLRVIVDFHQDVFGRPWYGDGFPLWACDRPLLEVPSHSPKWFMGYVNSDDVRRNFDRFWTNDDGLQDAFERMWTKMASTLSVLDAVVGFEVFNEPAWGTADPTTWAQEVLTPFYSRMAAHLHEIAPDCLVFFDVTGLDAISGTCALERPNGEGLVFAPHYYDPSAILEGKYNGEGDIDGPLAAWAAKGREWDVPVLVGEFGIDPGGLGAAEYVRGNYAALDANLLHGTLWEYSSTFDDWNDEAMSVVDGEGNEWPTISSLVRPYPSATAGTLQAFEYDPKSREGTWTFEASAGGISELVVPQRLYPGGVSGSIEGSAASMQKDGPRQRLMVRTDADGPMVVKFGPA